MVDTKCRVKVFTMKGSSQCTDCGTGHVKASHDDQEGVFLIVKAESDGKLILNSKIHSDKEYEKLQDNFMVRNRWYRFCFKFSREKWL